MMRDTLKDQNYWGAFIHSCGARVDKFTVATTDEKRSTRDRLRFASIATERSLELVIAKYSAGTNPQDMIEPLLHSLNMMGEFNKLARQIPEVATSEFGGGFDQIYRMLGLCILLEIDHSNTIVLANYIDFFNLRDAIFEIFLKELGHKEREPTNQLIWPEAYSLLLKAINSDTDEDLEFLMTFLHNWYSNMSGTPWHDLHMSKFDTYYGYWAFEAAAVAKLKMFDKNKFSKKVMFPRDLI